MRWTMYTVALIHGKKMPMENIPSNGPFVIASKLILQDNMHIYTIMHRNEEKYF